jgi:hypothetical protein
MPLGRYYVAPGDLAVDAAPTVGTEDNNPLRGYIFLVAQFKPILRQRCSTTA